MARPAISDERVIIEGPQSICIKLKSRWSDGTESLLFTSSEFLERLVALIPAPKFHTTRNYGVLASRSPHRRYLPDKRKRISWAQLLKRTFKIDVLKCDKCGGRMKLVGVVFDQPTITTTLRALGLPVRAPPIAPVRCRLVQLSKLAEDAGCLRFHSLHLSLNGNLRGLHFQKAKLGKSTDTPRRKGGFLKADRGGFYGRVRCAMGLIPLSR